MYDANNDANTGGLHCHNNENDRSQVSFGVTRYDLRTSFGRIYTYRWLWSEPTVEKRGGCQRSHRIHSLWLGGKSVIGVAQPDRYSEEYLLREGRT